MSIDPTKSATTKVSAAAANEAFQIVPITDEFEYLNMIVYGVPGSGKTTLAATAADVDEMADVLMLDIESGRLTIKDNKRIKNKGRIDAIRVNSYKQLAEVHKFLQAHCRLRDIDTPEAAKKLIVLQSRFTGVPVEKIKEPRRYRTVIIDSLSELDALCIYELLGLSVEMDLSEAMNDGDMEVAQFAEYKKNNQIMQLIVRAYRDLPINVLMTCHVAYTQNDLKQMFYAPSLTGKLRNQVQGFVDLVGYLRVGEVPEGKTEAPRRMYFQPVGKFDAKCRLAKLDGSFFDNPTMKQIFQAVSE